MKISLRQILASATGAVLAAVIASFFGVTGTVIGVAIGSAVATTASALVVQSIERGHKAVRQAVVGNPNRPAIFRRFGATEPVGAVAEETAESPVTEPSATPQGTAAIIDGHSEIGEAEPVTAKVPPSRGRPVPPALSGGTADRRWTIRWPVLALMIGLVFVLALVVVTGIELIAGKPLSSVVGSSSDTGGISLAPSSSATTTTTTTTVPTSTTTLPSTSTSTSTTTTPSSTTTVPSASTTTTTGPSTTTTTTTTTTPSVTGPVPTTLPGG